MAKWPLGAQPTEIIEGYLHPYDRKKQRVSCRNTDVHGIHGAVEGIGVIQVLDANQQFVLEYHADASVHGKRATHYVLTYFNSARQDLPRPELRIGYNGTLPFINSDKNCLVHRLSIGDQIKVFQYRSFFNRWVTPKQQVLIVASVQPLNIGS